MITIAVLMGIWSTSCIQTQISRLQHGYVKETYHIEKSGVFEFKREWFSDSLCTVPRDLEWESGTIDLGNRVQAPFLNNNSFEANFSSQTGIDYGAISMDITHINVARGVKNSSKRNLMVGLFQYRKQK
jgi:hypothetical protein